MNFVAPDSNKTIFHSCKKEKKGTLSKIASDQISAQQQLPTVDFALRKDPCWLIGLTSLIGFKS